MLSPSLPSSSFFLLPQSIFEDAEAVTIESSSSEDELICRRGSLTVLRRHDPSLQAEVVVKRVGLTRLSSRDQAEEEASLMQLVDHPNVLKCSACLPSEAHVDLVLEAGSSSLADLVRSSSPLPEKKVLSLFSQICQGLAAIHARGLVHGDLKPDNIIIVGGDAKIADFGQALLLPCAPEERLKELRGTPGFIAPEVILQQGCSTASDIWALGSTLFEMVTRQRPFADWNPNQILFQVGRGSSPQLSTPSPLFNQIIQACQSPCPEDRPTAMMLLELLSSLSSSSSSSSSSP